MIAAHSNWGGLTSLAAPTQVASTSCFLLGGGPTLWSSCPCFFRRLVTGVLLLAQTVPIRTFQKKLAGWKSITLSPIHSSLKAWRWMCSRVIFGCHNPQQGLTVLNSEARMSSGRSWRRQMKLPHCMPWGQQRQGFQSNINHFLGYTTQYKAFEPNNNSIIW